LKIIWLIVSQLRADHLGPYGNSWLPTKNIAALAKAGCLFTNAHSNYADGSAVRFEWLNGTKCDGNTTSAPAHSLPLLLSASGYKTTLITDNYPLLHFYYHINAFDTILFIPGQGADRHFPETFAEKVFSKTQNPPKINAGSDLRPSADEISRFLRNRENEKQSHSSAHRLFDAAGRFLEQLTPDDNWFILIDAFGLTPPWFAPTDFVHFRHQEDLDAISWPIACSVDLKSPSTKQAINHLRRAYADECVYYDSLINVFWPRIEAYYETAEPFRFFLLSDMSPLIGDDGFILENPSKDHPILTHQPMIVLGHDIDDNSQNAQPVLPVDIFATMVEKTGIAHANTNGGNVIEEL